MKKKNNPEEKENINSKPAENTAEEKSETENEEATKSEEKESRDEDDNSKENNDISSDEETTESISETSDEAEKAEDEDIDSDAEKSENIADKTKEKNPKKKTVIISLCCALAVLLIVGGVLFYNNYYVPEQKYEAAVKLYEGKNYNKALKNFETISEFKDSKKYITKCENNINLDKNYNAGVELFSEEKYTDALKLFKKCGNYKETQKYISESNRLNALLTKYNKALKLEDESEYDSAADLFKELKDYKDSKERIEKCKTEKKNWGKMKMKNAVCYSLPSYEGLHPIQYIFNDVKNATGYQVYAVNNFYGEHIKGEILTFQGKHAVFCDEVSADGGTVTFFFRAYKKCKGGKTMYGEWWPSSVYEVTGLKEITQNEFYKIKKESILIGSCYDSIII